MPLVNVVPAVEYEVNKLDGNNDDDVIPVPNEVGPVVRGCSNSAKIRLSCFHVHFYHLNF